MLLSISSSKVASPKACLLAILVVCMVAGSLVAGAEYYWRSQGYSPGIIGSAAMWSLHRDKATGDDVLVFIGASRTQFGIDLSAAREVFPEKEPVMLGLNGIYPLATLRHLAEDKSFSGTVLVDVDARGMHPAQRNMMDPYLEYYDRTWSPNWRWHRWLLNYWQLSMAVGRPELGAVATLVRWLDDDPSPWIPYYSFAADRTAGLNFTQTDGDRLDGEFADVMARDFQQNPPPPPRKWLESLAEVAEWTRQIESRGGRVVFYEAPAGGRQERLAEETYPREDYWDRFIQSYDLRGLHYRDVPALHNLPLPDGSHVRGEDRGRYTRRLLEAMRERGHLD